MPEMPELPELPELLLQHGHQRRNPTSGPSCQMRTTNDGALNWSLGWDLNP